MWSTIKGRGIECYRGCLFLAKISYSISLMGLKLIDQRCNLEQGVYGLISACLGLISLHAIFGQFGSSQPVITALLITSACALVCGLLVSRRLVSKIATPIISQQLHRLIVLLILALLVSNLPSLSQLSSEIMSNLPAQFMASTWGMTTGLLIPCFLCWGGALFLLTVEFGQLDAPEQRARVGWCGVGCILLPIMVFPFLSLVNTAMLLLISCSMLIVYRIYLNWYRRAESRQVIQVQETVEKQDKPPFSYQQIMVLAGLTGMMTAAVRYYSNLILSSEILCYAELGFCLWGCGFGMTYSVRQQKTEKGLAARSLVGLAGPGLSGLMLIMFPYLTLGILWSTTYLQYLELIVLSKLLAVMMFYLPAGFLCGLCLTEIFNARISDQQTSSSSDLKRLVAILLFISLSIWCTRYVLLGQIGVAKTFIFWSAWMIVWNLQVLGDLFAYLWLRAKVNSVPQKTWSRFISVPRAELGLAWVIVAIIVLQPYTQRYYQPEKSAQLLFSGTSFGAYREHVRVEDIPQVEGNRVLLQEEGALSTLLAFTYRNAQMQIRKSGTPSSIVSRDPEICPHFSGDMLATILPLVMHEGPRKVCVLGAAGGASAKVVSVWPLHEATIYDPDHHFMQKLGEIGIIPWYQSVREQSHLHFNNTDLCLANWSMPYEQDVIVVNTDLSALAATAPCYADTHLRRVKSHLSPRGIFALRFNYTDYGRQPLIEIAETFSKLFEDTMMFEAAPGEMVLLGSQVKDQLTSSIIIQNLQTSQARRLIAEIGWDWSIILNLNIYNHAAIKQLAAGVVNHQANDNLAFKHPLELYSWHQKSQEVSNLLDKKSTRLIAIHEQHPLKDDILYRLSDIAAREKLLYDHPDEPWAYRKFAKERLQKHTRSEIITVKGEGLKKKIHDVDQRRLDYFESLGVLLQKSNPSLGDIRMLYEYNDPYDPVISYFLHNEVARICARLEPVERVEELRCRMHMIYYGSLSDRSVIDICKCLKLLTELLPGEITPEERWEYANGLCEQLKIRWRARVCGASVPPVIEISDLKESISAVRSIVELFPAWGQEANIDQQIIISRIRMVDKLLISSLQNYKLERLKKLEDARQSSSTQESKTDDASPIFGF